MANHGVTFCVLSPVAASHVFAWRIGAPVGSRACQNVMLIDDDLTAGNTPTILGATDFDIDLVFVRMQFIYISSNLHALCVYPGPLTNAIARVDCRFITHRLGAEIGAPRLVDRTRLCRQ